MSMKNQEERKNKGTKHPRLKLVLMSLAVGAVFSVGAGVILWQQDARKAIAAAAAFLLIGPFMAATAKIEKYVSKTKAAPTRAPQPAQVAVAQPQGTVPQRQQQKMAPQQPQKRNTPNAGQQQKQGGQKPAPSKPAAKKPDAPVRQPAAQIPAETPGGIQVRLAGNNITFDDIAGYEETKRNMKFLADCLKKPELLKQVGAKVPSGVLLYGPPGTGKTLFASAMAGSAGVNFYEANASEFINTYSGTGPKNVRALYEAAKANAPSIVFIDEIDAIGGQRNEAQNQEYRATLNALLSEMDGINKSGVMTIAATNTYESLDPALLRPGRFDRKIAVPLPSQEDRLAIIKLYAKKRNLEETISLEKLARDTQGMSGAHINTLFNEASIRAVMNNRGIITAEDMDAALTQMLTNGENTKAGNKEDLRIAAYHEAGHAIVMRELCGDDVPKVTIMGNTSGMVGTTFSSGNGDRLLTSMQQIRARIISAYAGRAAEELVYGEDNVTSAAKQDIQFASEWIREYLQYGAGNSLLDEDTFGQTSYNKLEEARKLSVELYSEAKNYLQTRRAALDRIANALLDHETVLEDELTELLKD